MKCTYAGSMTMKYVRQRYIKLHFTRLSPFQHNKLITPTLMCDKTFYFSSQDKDHKLNNRVLNVILMLQLKRCSMILYYYNIIYYMSKHYNL